MFYHFENHYNSYYYQHNFNRNSKITLNLFHAKIINQAISALITFLEKLITGIWFLLTKILKTAKIRTLL